MKKYLRLLEEYSELKDAILEFTEEFHDSMQYDIIGFNSIDEDDVESFLPELEKQVKSFRLILKGLNGVSYTFA